MADNDIVRRGYLHVIQKPKGGVIGRVLSVSSRRYWVVLRRENSRVSNNRIELYRNEEQSGEPHKTINLIQRNIRNIETVDRKKAFLVAMLDESIMFQCSSRAEMDDWYKDLKTYLGGMGIVSPPSSTTHSNSVDIYEVIPDDESFHVRLRKAKSLPFFGPCILEILRDFDRNLFHIALYTEDSIPRLIVKWQIDHVRQYGSNNMAFKFESGTKSSTGVDWFIVDTEPGFAAKIHKAVDYWAKHIVEQVKNLPSSTGQSTPRRSTFPRETPDNTNIPPSSNSMTSNGHGGSLGAKLSPSKAPESSVYMPIHQGSLAPSTVYARPDASTQPRSNKPPLQPPSNTSESTYMPLNPSSMVPNQQLYEGITHTTAERSARPPPEVNGSNSNAVYMGIDPRTKNVESAGQYMGLKQARN